tara:strand:+ start:312 stop:1655 length:1344 start_codon:yes stop_codon:yes gene_type:complete
MYVLNDDIVALATLPGKSALNVIRVSGKNVIKIYRAITLSSKKPRANFAHVSCIYNQSDKKQIDYSLLTYFKGPKSYTGEDVLEISTHGGNIIVKQVIESLISKGARQALPGEFTYRAYINGKIDLLQAEGIAAIVEANNNIDSYYHLNTINGTLTKEIQKNKDSLMSLMTIAEHELDFLDSEIEKKELQEYNKSLNKLYLHTKKIIKKSLSSEQQSGNLQVAIIGRPNAGKSSLFNLLTGHQKSIITNIKGTTRDPVESNIDIGNHEVKIIDTAGLRTTKDVVEIKGIEKTFAHIEEAQIIIIIDEKNASQTYLANKNKFKQKSVILVNNKNDINNHKQKNGVFSISCKKKNGFNSLLTHLSTLCNQKVDRVYKESSFSINVRQKSLLQKICRGINKANKSLETTGDLTICLSSLYGVLDLYNELIRPDAKNKIINEIFKGFCVGK